MLLLAISEFSAVATFVLETLIFVPATTILGKVPVPVSGVISIEPCEQYIQLPSSG